MSAATVPVFRPARPEDQTLIAKFQLAMAWETEAMRLDAETCAEGVRAVFARPALGRYHVAEQAGQVIGSLLIVPEWSDWRNGTVWWVHSVYLRPETRGQKIFGQFYRYVQELTRTTDGIRGLRLYVDRRNQHAQKVYRALGMNSEHYELYEWMKD